MVCVIQKYDFCWGVFNKILHGDGRFDSVSSTFSKGNHCAHELQL